MGFRVALSSAAAVDTRSAPTVAGVRMYQAPNPDNGDLPYGILEWTDSSPGDVPARITQTANPSPRGNATPYGRLAVKGGSYGTPAGLTAAPELDLSVEADPVTAAVVKVARLVGAATLDLGGAKLVNVAFSSLDDTGWAPMAPSGSLGAGYAVGGDGARWRRWGQLIEFQIHALGTGTGTLFTFPSWAWTTAAHWWTPEWGGVGVGEVKLAAGGVLSVSARTSSPGIVVSGSYLIG